MKPKNKQRKHLSDLVDEWMTAYHSPNYPGRPTFKCVKVAASGEIFSVD